MFPPTDLVREAKQCNNKAANRKNSKTLRRATSGFEIPMRESQKFKDRCCVAVVNGYTLQMSTVS